MISISSLLFWYKNSIEEKIVCHADSLIDNCEKQNIEKEVKRALMEGHKEYAERLVNLHNELSYICGMDVNLL